MTVQAFQGAAFFGMAVATTLPGLFVSRLVMGVMGASSTFAFMMAGRAGNAFAVRRQVAAVQSGMTIGQVIGPLAGALVAARIGFRPSFAVGGVILLGCAALVGWLAPESEDAGRGAGQQADVRVGELVVVGLIVLGAIIHIFFLPAILPQVLPALGVAPATPAAGSRAGRRCGCWRRARSVPRRPALPPARAPADRLPGRHPQTPAPASPPAPRTPAR